MAGTKYGVGPGLKIILAVAAIGLAAAAFVHFKPKAPEVAASVSSVPRLAAETPVKALTATAQTGPIVLPSRDVAPQIPSTPEIRQHAWAWSAQDGKFAANGGVKTTTGSLMDRAGVRVSFARQDDTDVSKGELVKFAQELLMNPEPKSGIHFVSIMGNGAAPFLKGLNDALAPLDSQHPMHGQVVGSSGFSDGEDKFMGPSAWKDTPSAAKGGVVAAFPMDGDQAIVETWAAENSDSGCRDGSLPLSSPRCIPTNPDPKTYDPDAINYVAAKDFLDAAAKLIEGACEDRPVVHAGKPTGKTQKVCPDGAATWTPGDVNIAMKKGGVVSIVSTHEYRSMMPEVIIGIDRWNEAHAELVGRMLSAIFDAGAQIQRDSSGIYLHRACEIAAELYADGTTADYWQKYYLGAVEIDKTHRPIRLGGSRVNTLQDNLDLFGLAPGASNKFADTYTAFGQLMSEKYPKEMPDFPAASSVFDPRYIRIAEKLSGDKTTSSVQEFKSATGFVQVVSRKNWSIQFASGQSSIGPEAAKVLQELKQDADTNGLHIRVEGHTDNQGRDQDNKVLSQARAEAVRNWLYRSSSANYGESRFVPCDQADGSCGYGASLPVSTNNTKAGRALNRRVTITFGTVAGDGA